MRCGETEPIHELHNYGKHMKYEGCSDIGHSNWDNVGHHIPMVYACIAYTLQYNEMQ